MRACPVKFSVSTGLRLCGMADEPFCPGEKYSSASSTSVRCKWRISTASRSMEPAITASVAKNMACRSRGMTWGGDRLDREAQLLRDIGFHFRRDIREGANRPGNGTGRNLRPCRPEARLAAVELGMSLRQLEAKGGRLRMDAVAAADGGGMAVLLCPALQRRQQVVEVGQQKVRCLRQLHRQGGVQHIAGSHPLGA